MIRFPNEFSGDNYSFVLEFDNNYDFSKIIDVKLPYSLVTNKLIITFSNMSSTINDVQKIYYK